MANSMFMLRYPSCLAPKSLHHDNEFLKFSSLSTKPTKPSSHSRLITMNLPMQTPYNVLITGSTKGIGYALAKQFLKAGDNIIISSRSEERVESALNNLRQDFGEHHVWGTTCDVKKGQDVKDLVAFAQKNLNYIDIWINNAGSNAYSFKPLAEASDEDLIEVVTTNTLGLMICCREAIKMMRSQPQGGHIFNIDGAGSDGRPTPRFAAYGATKRSVVHLTKSLQAELQMQDVKNVVVHNLSPGMVTTDLLMSGATTKQAKFFINVLAEPAEVVAEYLVPRIRSIPANGSTKPTYLRFLTGIKAYSQIFSVVLYSRNCLSSQEQIQNPSKFCQNEALAVKITPHDKQKRSKTPGPKSVLASSMVGGTVGGIAFLGIGLLVVRKFHDKTRVKAPSTRWTMENVSTFNTVKLLSDAWYISQTMKLGANLPVYRTFALEELKEATNNFDASSLMSEGSHGQMYRGKLADGTLVAIRSLRMRERYNSQIYTHHIELISKLRHSHLVSALGHCLAYDMDASSISNIYLIFEFVPYGTLRSSKGPKLTWIQRIAAAIRVAKGIQFLHTGIVPGVFSNNIKITDVLLDQNLHVKLSTYNLPLLADSMGMGNAVVSFPGRKANFLTRMQNEDKSDVYDIGVILLEIIVGRPIMSQNEVFVANDLLQASITKDNAARKSIVDPEIKNECSDESLKRMMELCVMCLSNQPTHRPSIEDILWNLQFATQVQNSTHNNNQELV